MKLIKTKAIVLSRFNYGETDRILTVISPDLGKLRLIAKGSRAMKSKLAGGIELFTVNDIAFIRGRTEIATLVSSRMNENFKFILTDINRVQFGYELLKTINQTIEDAAESEYYDLLETTLKALNDLMIDLDITRLWFMARLIAITGHMPNLVSEADGKSLDLDKKYNFNLDSMCFEADLKGKFMPNHIKFLRLSFSLKQPLAIAHIKEAGNMVNDLMPIISSMRQQHL